VYLAMGSLVFVGLGLAGSVSLSGEGVNAAKAADKVYLEVYTSPSDDGLRMELEEVVGFEVELVSREMVEDGRRIIEESRDGNVVLFASGDSMVATTHMDLRVMAAAEGVETRVVHNASILSALIGETGLHAYKFGKTVTMARSGPTLHTTVYNTVFENLVRRLHTVVLLEHDYASGFFFDPLSAIKGLLGTEAELKQGIFDEDTLLIFASRVGRPDQSVVAGRVSTLRMKEFGEPPHVLVVPGRLHFTEIDALKTLLKTGEEEIRDNSERVPRLAEKMVNRYTKKARAALEKARALCSEEEGQRYAQLFENVECYVSDAERFLDQGKDELAVLSTGYAEGLLDALTYLSDKFLNIWEQQPTDE
jgi:diphthine synthase